jgi:hypothetical protein
MNSVESAGTGPYLLLLAGVVLIVAAIAGSIKAIDIEIPLMARPVQRTVVFILGLALVLAGSLLIFNRSSGNVTPTPSATSTPSPTRPPPPTPSALIAGKILKPANDDQIPQAIEARGTATNIPASHQLWLFLARTGSGSWLRGNGFWDGREQSYLQIKDGYWNQGDLEFGAKDDPPGDQYELALVVLGPAGIKRMQTYGPDGIPRDEVLSYPDTILLDTIRVYRK